MTEGKRPPFPALNFDNGNNACASLHTLAEFARRGDVKVIQDGLDGTGKLVLRFQLPGSQTVKARTIMR